MIRCTSCQAAVPSHTTFFAATGEVCERCHTLGEIRERDERAYDDYDDEPSISLGGVSFGSEGLVFNLDELWPRRRSRGRHTTDVAEAPTNRTRSAPLLYVTMGAVVAGQVGSFLTFFWSPTPAMEFVLGMCVVMHVALGFFGAFHMLMNGRLSTAKTFGWFGAAWCLPTIGLFTYLLLEVIRGDQAESGTLVASA